jgi:KDO2-lipid IV(A) lauroyltransferase
MRANKAGFLQDVLSSGPSVRLGLLIGQYLPPRVGYGVAWFIAGMIVRLKTKSYRTVSDNLRHVVGPQVDEETLHKMAHKVLVHAGRAYYDFYRAANWPPEQVVQAVHVPEAYIDFMRAQAARGRGTLLLGLHMSNFDLAMVAIGSRGIPTQVLSLADPGEGFRVQDRLRSTAGIEVTPISPMSLRLAIQRLQSGWIVLTGADRPVPDERQPVAFFGRPSNLSTGPVRIALKSGAIVLVASCHHDADKGHVVDFTGPVEMVRSGDRQQDIQVNARRVAAILEDHVRAYPEQWLMFHPVWPRSPRDSGISGS